MAPSLSFWEYTVIFFLRPLFAIVFVLFLISSGWFVAWKLVLVHVPLVQEVFGLKKKPVRVKPQIGRFSKIYSTLHAQNSPPTRGRGKLKVIVDGLK
ncbi:uncharacterized protein LOC108333364 isoform X2 [Vigna angularis]|uniref:uncharacterized protein LOC108333364 isoform X2 n=1 Tax=Phaseolus angularis TaxID=3914 RepID=UPI00080A4062|nr:uncharacterized protein LOC108333364 isoform X2 [Vigna angularis]